MLTSKIPIAVRWPGGAVSLGVPINLTVPFAFVDTITKLTSIPSETRFPVIVQPFPSPRLKCCGVPSVNSITPKSVVSAGKCGRGFEQPMINAAVKATPAMKYGMRIKSRRCLTKKAEPPPTRGVNRDSGTDSANGGWVNCWVLHSVPHRLFLTIPRRDLAPESSFPSIPKPWATISS